MRCIIPRLLALVLCHSHLALAGTWKVVEAGNPDGPGQMIQVVNDEAKVARLIFGEGQMKPYLHVFGTHGELLTNPGLTKEGKRTGAYPHHRGIFIGWRISSDLGNWDLWHMNRGGDIRVAEVETLSATETSARVRTRNEWHAGKTDGKGSSLLITEWRDMTFARPSPGRTQIDVSFSLRAERDLRLGGDLQHAGIHFRAANEVAKRSGETSYLQSPKGAVKGNNLQWCQLHFPIGNQWYSALHMNSTANPVEELSMRNYGRFGYFFKRALKAGETLELSYRFVVEAQEAPANAPRRSEAQLAADRKDCEALYEAFTKAAAR